MALTLAALGDLDRNGYQVMDALSPVDGITSNTATAATRFLCIDGNKYWVKVMAHNGLASEVIAGRLAERLDAGSPARIIRVTPAATAGATRFEGLWFGSQDRPGTVISKEMQALTPIQVTKLDPIRLARVLVFQTWIGMEDHQMLVSAVSGDVFAVDHGLCFSDAAIATLSDPGPVVTHIPGVQDNDRKQRDPVVAAVDQIEALTERDVLAAITCIPNGTDWRSEVDRRLQIGLWLQHRQGRLRKVMDAWLRI